MTFNCEIYALCNITDLKNYNSYYSPINNKVRLTINQILNWVNVCFHRNPFFGNCRILLSIAVPNLVL